MTVPSQIPVTEHLANGVTTAFPFGFLCFSAGDLEVLADLVPVSPASYSVSGLDVPTGGSVTFLVAPAAGVKITIRLDVVLERDTDYQTSGDLLAKTVNRDFDRLWLAQQGSSVDIDSALKFPPGEPAGYLPVIADRKGKALIFNEVTGAPEPSVDDYNDQAAAAAASAAEAANANQAAQAAAGSASADAAAAELARQQAEAAVTGMAEFVTVVPSGGITSANVQAALYELDQKKVSKDGTKWYGHGIGELVLIWDHLPGADIPPTNDPGFRYVKLTAADSYNTGVLTNESVSGSAPFIVATARVSLTGSPVDGLTISLINTERRAIRSGSSGTLQDDALQNMVGTVTMRGNAASVLVGGDGVMGAGNGATSGLSVELLGTTVATNVISFDASRSVRTAVETRMRNIGASFYMRVK